MQKPIFILDFSGPLINRRALDSDVQVDPIGAGALQKALVICDGEIVVSSSWRHLGKEACLQLLDSHPWIKLGRFLADAWCIDGDEPTPCAVTRAGLIATHIEREGISPGRVLVIDDMVMERLLPCEQAVADVNAGLHLDQIEKMLSWAKQRAPLDAIPAFSETAA